MALEGHLLPPEKQRRAHEDEWACMCGMTGWAFERKPEAPEEAPEGGQGHLQVTAQASPEEVVEMLKPYPGHCARVHRSSMDVLTENRKDSSVHVSGDHKHLSVEEPGRFCRIPWGTQGTEAWPRVKTRLSSFWGPLFRRLLVAFTNQITEDIPGPMTLSTLDARSALVLSRQGLPRPRSSLLPGGDWQRCPSSC